MTEDVSAPEDISPLGFGAAPGLSLSAALTPLVLEAQEPAPATPAATPLPPQKKPPGHTGCNDVHRAAAIVVSSTAATMSNT